MQTFLPYSNFFKSAHCLDQKRLNKQRVEVLQILKALTISNYKWKDHPAVKMWRSHELTLCRYGIIICEEWLDRGYKDTCLSKIWEIYVILPTTTNPKWLGNKNFHSSHRAALLHKNFEYYKQFKWIEQPKLDYVWPLPSQQKELK